MADISNNHSAMKYLGSKDLVSAVIWSDKSQVYGSNAYAFYVPRAEVTEYLLDSNGAYAGPVRALDALRLTAFSRYVYPQVVYRAVRDQRLYIPWLLSDAWIGVE